VKTKKGSFFFLEANLGVPLCSQCERLREQDGAWVGNMASVRKRGCGKHLAEEVILGEELMGLGGMESINK
jgi:hypothetical protein